MELKETRCTARQAQQVNDHCATASLLPSGELVIEAVPRSTQMKLLRRLEEVAGRPTGRNLVED